MMQRMHVPRFAVALVGAMALSFVAGQLSVAHGAVRTETPAMSTPPEAACGLSGGGPEADQPMDPPSPYGFNQPG